MLVLEYQRGGIVRDWRSIDEVNLFVGVGEDGIILNIAYQDWRQSIADQDNSQNEQHDYRAPSGHLVPIIKEAIFVFACVFEQR